MTLVPEIANNGPASWLLNKQSSKLTSNKKGNQRTLTIQLFKICGFLTRLVTSEFICGIIFSVYTTSYNLLLFHLNTENKLDPNKNNNIDKLSP